MMKDIKKTLLIGLCTLPLFALTFAGAAYAFYASKAAPDSVEVTTTKVRTDLSFALNGSFGIPGETLVIAEEGSNNIRKTDGSADYIFRMTYEVSYPSEDGDIEYIQNLRLKENTESGLLLIKAGEYDTATRTLTYFGKHTGNEEIFLGELLATFNILKNPSMAKPYEVNALIEACQATETAVNDMFGINSTVDDDKYAELFE